MGKIQGNEQIVTNGLILALDASDRNSYPGTGTSWFDMSGNGNTGTLVNSPTFSTSNGGVLVFDGNSKRVTTTVQRRATMSLECFFKPNVQTGNNILFGSQGTGVDLIKIGKERFGATTWVIFFGPNGYTDSASSGYNSWDGNWHHMCFSSNNGTGSLYIDGVLRFGPHIFGATSRTDSLIIGGDGPNETFFNGSIANVKFYSTSLSLEQVSQNYNAEKSRFGL